MKYLLVITALFGAFNILGCEEDEKDTAAEETETDEAEEESEAEEETESEESTETEGETDE